MTIKKQTELFERYAKIRQLKEKLEAEEREVKDQILQGLDETVTSSYGIFTPVTRTYYKYSDKVKKLEAKAKEQVKEIMEPVVKLKKIEEIDGTAEAIESKSMSYRGVKNE